VGGFDFIHAFFFAPAKKSSRTETSLFLKGAQPYAKQRYSSIKWEIFSALDLLTEAIKPEK